MSKEKKPINANTKRFLYIVIGGTLLASIAIVTIATIGKNKNEKSVGSASITQLVPRASQEQSKPSPAALERLERVQTEEAKAAKAAGQTYIPENYLGSPEEVRLAIESGELEEKVTPSYQHYQESSENFSRQQRVSVGTGQGETEGLGSLESGVLNQLEGILANMSPATVTTVQIMDYVPNRHDDTQALESTQTQGAEQQPNPLIGADEILAAVLVTPIDTYVTQFAMAEIVGGEFNGAQLRGQVLPMTGSGDVEDVGIRFTSLRFNGRHYGIDAIALNETTATDAMDGKVDRRYFSRYVMPILVAGLSGASTYFTARGTQAETVMRGGGIDQDGNVFYNDVLVERERASKQDATNQGIGRAIESAGSIAQREVSRAASRPQRVKMAAYTPIGLIFNQPVFENN